MKMRIWNAYASNNSGSYTIVGRFSTPQLAKEVATELADLIQTHDDWINSNDYAANNDQNPLEVFAKKQGLKGYENIGLGNEWPESYTELINSFAVSHQVIIHHSWTVTLPRLFGEYFYAKGGRVDHEINHAHNTIYSIFELDIPWNERKNVDVSQAIQSVIEELNRDDGPLANKSNLGDFPPAWRASSEFLESDLTIGAIFTDLLPGFTGIEKIAKKHKMVTNVKVFEAFSAKADPLEFLRPSSPSIN